MHSFQEEGEEGEVGPWELGNEVLVDGPRRGRYGTNGAQKYSSFTDITPTVMCCMVVRCILPPKYIAAGH
jgi:hypothetical protein